jgi:hypothetical protein
MRKQADLAFAQTELAKAQTELVRAQVEECKQRYILLRSNLLDLHLADFHLLYKQEVELGNISP